MTFHDDPNRPVDPVVRRPIEPPVERGGMSWGIPLTIAAVALIAGLLFFNTAGDRTTTASNDPSVARQTNPPAPAPAPTPPAKTQ